MPRVLVIDDCLTTGAPLRMVLQNLGMEVYCETPAGLDIAKGWSEPVDLLVVDLEAEDLPQNYHSGWDIVQMFKDYNYTGMEPKVVVVTESNYLSSRLLGNVHAVSAYLLKPLRADDLASTVQRILGTWDVSPAK